MRFLLGVLVGYSMRGERKLLITVLATVAFIVYILLPAVALVALHLDVQQERQSSPAQTRVPALKGLSYNAATKLHASKLNIRFGDTLRSALSARTDYRPSSTNLERKLFTVPLLM